MNQKNEAIAWPDVEYPRFGNAKASQIAQWQDDPSWPIRYTNYAEGLHIAAEALRYTKTEPEGADSSTVKDLLEQLGDPSRGIWEGLDTTKRSQEDNGRFLLEEIFRPALQRQLEAERSELHPGEDANAITAWHVAFSAASRIARAEVFREITGTEAPADINAWIRKVSWPQGLKELEYRHSGAETEYPSLTPVAARGLRSLTATIDQLLSDQVPRDEGFDYDRPFDGLLPPDIAAKLTERKEKLAEYRTELKEKGLAVEGIDENGLTDILLLGLPILKKRLAEHNSFLLIGPTTTGKTDFSRIAASSVIWQKRKVIVLLPTKALVSQAAEEWREFFAGCKSSENWRLLEASRDHPFNDEDIARGDYDIVLAIPEKLAAYLAGGSRILDQCGLLVVDELQTLNQRHRGANIESLLTIVKAQYPNLPIIGLSATLTSESSKDLRTWLDVGSGSAEGFIETSHRPVSLNRYAANPNEWQMRTQQGDIVQAEWEPPLYHSVLQDMLKNDLARPAHRDAVELASRLLLREDSVANMKSILIFVGSRRAAERITHALQSALELLDGSQATTWKSPHKGRFGRQVLTAGGAAERDQEFAQLPNVPATQDLREGLRTGIMYHSARLDPEHRRLIEHAFRDKVIRVLVATATLAVGMNLPADFVIVADITDGTSLFDDNRPVERLLDPHDMAQRFGRCGRLGMSTEGEAYVIVQRHDGRSRSLQLTEEQVKLFGDPANANATPKALADRVDYQMASLEGIFNYFVMSDDTGEPVRSNLDVKGFARLLLQDICRNTPTLSTEELGGRVDRIYEHSLLLVEGRERPETFELLDMLDAEQLIGLAPEDPKNWKITGLGRTVALSNVPVANSRGIREVAEAALLGAGPLTLLTIAAQAEYVRDLSWLSLPRDSPELVDQIRHKAWQIVRAFAAPASANPGAFYAPEFLDVISEDPALVGYGPSAQSLRGRVNLGIDGQSDTTLVSHLRACIAILWEKGYPINSLISFVEKNTLATIKGRSRAVPAYPADIRDLGERLSYVLNAASEVLRVAPEDGRHLMLKNLAEALQSGIPYQLAPMLRLRSPRIHRERLVALLDMREDGLDFDDLPAVLRTLNKPRADRSAQQKRAHLNQAFSEEETKNILTQMSRRKGRTGAKALPPELRDQNIPSQTDVEGPISYGRVADDMVRKQSLDDKVEELTFVLEQFGLVVESTINRSGAILEVSRDGAGDSVEIYLLDLPLGKPLLNQLIGERRALVVMQGITPGAEYVMRSSGTRGFSAMTTWVFLAGLARIDRSWRLTYFGDDPDAELARRVLKFFGNAMGPISLSDVALAEVAAGLPAPPPLFLR